MVNRGPGTLELLREYQLKTANLKKERDIYPHTKINLK